MADFFSVNSDVRNLSGVSAEDLNYLLANTGLAGLGASFVSLEQRYQINAVFAMAHAAEESGWGNSYLAQNRNNIFGIRAYTSDPAAAEFFSSKDACIQAYGILLANFYLRPPEKDNTGNFLKDADGNVLGEFWGDGTTILDVFKHYSTSGPVEAEHIVEIMNEEGTKLYYRMKVNQPAVANIPAVAPDSAQYIKWDFKQGDSLWNIAAVLLNDPSKWEQLAKLNGITNQYDIQPGTTILVPNPNYKPTTVVQASVTIPGPTEPNYRSYTVQASDGADGLSGIAYRELGNAYRWHEIAALNPNIIAPKYIIYKGEQIKIPLK